MERLLWICLAGAVGSGTRYLVGLWAGERFGPGFPVGTLLVNVAGCFLMGLVMQLAADLTTFPPTLRLTLATGFLGGLTTYSSFNYDTLTLLNAGQRTTALANFGITTVACLVAGVLGLALARRIAGV